MILTNRVMILTNHTLISSFVAASGKFFVKFWQIVIEVSASFR